MKYTFSILVAIMVLISGVGIAQAAIPFPTNAVDFSGSGTDGSITYLEIGNNSSSFSYAYSHILSGLSPVGINLATVTLSLTHHGNSATNGETWLSYTGGNLLMGTLSESNGPEWVTDTWVLDSSVLAEMLTSNPWTLNVNLVENTNGTDRIKIDKSELNGTYNPVAHTPEPASMALLGMGLVGFLARRKQKKI